ncbi:uncharacterized protein [Miscanthus floridulus]|uniref:uncharacterized protein isoform X2 n=1 Tax=Miscanthus floridulus TaxID=154761 RepID=UPI0034591A07
MEPPCFLFTLEKVSIIAAADAMRLSSSSDDESSTKLPRRDLFLGMTPELQGDAGLAAASHRLHYLEMSHAAVCTMEKRRGDEWAAARRPVYATRTSRAARGRGIVAAARGHGKVTLLVPVRRVLARRQERRQLGCVHGRVLPRLPLPLHRRPRALLLRQRRPVLPRLRLAVAPGALPRLPPPPLLLPRRRAEQAPGRWRRRPQDAAARLRRWWPQAVRRRRTPAGAQGRGQRRRLQPDPGGRRGRRRGAGRRRVQGLLPAAQDHLGSRRHRGARGRARVIGSAPRQVRGGRQGQGARAALLVGGPAARAHRPGHRAGRQPGHDGREAADAQARDAPRRRLPRPRRPPLHRRVLRRRQAPAAAAPDDQDGPAVGAADRRPPRRLRRRRDHGHAGAGAGAAERVCGRRAAQGDQGARGPTRPQPGGHRHAALRHPAAAAGAAGGDSGKFDKEAVWAASRGPSNALHPRGDPHRPRRRASSRVRVQGGVGGASRGARVRQVPGRAGERGDAGGAPGTGVPEGGDHGGVLVRARAAGRGGLRRRWRGGERAAGRDVRGGRARAAGGGARAAGQPPALAVGAVQLPRPGVAGDGPRRGAAAAAAPAPGRAGVVVVVTAAARPVRGDARRGGVAAAGGAAGPGDGDPSAVVGAGAGAAVAADAAAAGAGGQPGHGAERHAVAACQPASVPAAGAADADVEERQEEGRW